MSVLGNWWAHRLTAAKRFNLSPFSKTNTAKLPPPRRARGAMATSSAARQVQVKEVITTAE